VIKNNFEFLFVLTDVYGNIIQPINKEEFEFKLNGNHMKEIVLDDNNFDRGLRLTIPVSKLD